MHGNKKTIEKIQQTAREIREEALTLIKSQQNEIKSQFQTLSKEVDNLRETKGTLDQDLAKLEKDIARINEQFKQSTVRLVTNRSEQIAWGRLISVEKKLENTNNQQEQQLELLDDQQFALPGTFPEQYCEGRHCAKCGKCRDWYFTGDADTWVWIRNHKNWNESDINRWRSGHVLEQFQCRDGNTCSFDHGLGLPGLPPGPNLDHRLFGLHLCLCEDNIQSDSKNKS